jgi:uracil-DNA glycosylase
MLARSALPAARLWISGEVVGVEVLWLENRPPVNSDRIGNPIARTEVFPGRSTTPQRGGRTQVRATLAHCHDGRVEGHMGGDEGDGASREVGAVSLPNSWFDPLADRIDVQRLIRDINQLFSVGSDPVYPDRSQVFRAFHLTPLEDVRVVILGQDPYTRPGEADGLAFSMPKASAPLPRSLQAIYANIANDPDLAARGDVLGDPGHGDLTAWAERGVLLLNTWLTVGSKAGSHKRLWRGFGGATLKLVCEKPEPVVFLLWGAPSIRAARAIRMIAEGNGHLFSCSAHPSAWTPGRLKPFAEVRHFSTANQHLGDRAVDWSLPPA